MMMMMMQLATKFVTSNRCSPCQQPTNAGSQMTTTLIKLFHFILLENGSMKSTMFHRFST